MAGQRPVAFIGSSKEGLEIAKAIQANLEYAVEGILWCQGVFGLSGGTLETLVNVLDDYDFAILVLTPDDLVESREEKRLAPRDNVLLELGMFIGALGRERTFAVIDRSAQMKLPSDLAGITLAEFEPPGRGTAQSAVGPACTKIETAVKKLGPRPAAKLSAEIDPSSEFQVIHDLLDQSVELFFILMNDQNVAIKRGRYGSHGIWYQYHNSTTYCSGSGHFSMNTACEKLAEAGLLQVNLKDEVTLTDRGKAFVAWLKQRNFADYFDSSIGGWGDRPADMQELREEFTRGIQSPRQVRVDPNKKMLPEGFGPPAMADPVSKPAEGATKSDRQHERRSS